MNIRRFPPPLCHTLVFEEGNEISTKLGKGSN